MGFGHTVTDMTLLGQPGGSCDLPLCWGQDLTPFSCCFSWISLSHSLMSREGSKWQWAGSRKAARSPAELNQDSQGRKQVME